MYKGQKKGERRRPMSDRESQVAKEKVCDDVLKIYRTLLVSEASSNYFKQAIPQFCRLSLVIRFPCADWARFR